MPPNIIYIYADDLLGVDCPPGKDGQSFLHDVLGSETRRSDPDYVVYASHQGPALVMADGWKLRYVSMKGRFQLYCLPEDYREERDLAADHPARVESMRKILLRECDGDLKYGHAQVQCVEYPDRTVKE